MARHELKDPATIRRRLRGARARRERAEHDREQALRDTAELLAAGRAITPRVPMSEMVELAGFSREAGYALLRWLDNPKGARWPSR